MGNPALPDLIQAVWKKADSDPFAPLYDETLRHLRQHRCHCYPYDKGPFLLALMAELRPRRALEIGTALGYSALCMAAGGADHVDTIEADRLHVTIARRNIMEGGHAGTIEVHHGRFDQVASGLAPGYDFAFFDGRSMDAATCVLIERLMAADGALLSANLNFARGSDRLPIYDTRLWETHFIDDSGESAFSRRKMSSS